MSGAFGTVGEPINDSKGCGGVMRSAPAAFFSDDAEEAFRLGAEIAAITHGHPSGFWSAGALAAMVHELLAGADLLPAVEAAQSLAVKADGGAETAEAIGAGNDLARRGVPIRPPRPEPYRNVLVTLVILTPVGVGFCWRRTRPTKWRDFSEPEGEAP